MTLSHANYHQKDYDEDLMTKCANEGCSYYFYYMGRTELCESCRGLK
jgi:hypothetical protein